MAANHQWRRILPSRFHLTRFLSSSRTSHSSATGFLHSSHRRRRVVVTGLGMVTPLGCGVETTWKRLIEGECGIRALTTEDLRLDAFDGDTQSHVFDQLTSKVAAIVPTGTNNDQYNHLLWSKEHRSISRFIGYALCAADEALRDANWVPTKQEEKERTKTTGCIHRRWYWEHE